MQLRLAFDHIRPHHMRIGAVEDEFREAGGAALALQIGEFDALQFLRRVRRVTGESQRLHAGILAHPDNPCLLRIERYRGPALSFGSRIDDHRLGEGRAAVEVQGRNPRSGFRRIL
jgi:hypothetical protein